MLSKEYQNMAQMEEDMRWNKSIKAQHPQHSQIMREMPQFATMDTGTYHHHLGKALTASDELFAFCANKRILPWEIQKVCKYGKKVLLNLSKCLIGA